MSRVARVRMRTSAESNLHVPDHAGPASGWPSSDVLRRWHLRLSVLPVGIVALVFSAAVCFIGWTLGHDVGPNPTTFRVINQTRRMVSRFTLVGPGQTFDFGKLAPSQTSHSSGPFKTVYDRPYRYTFVWNGQTHTGSFQWGDPDGRMGDEAKECDLTVIERGGNVEVVP